MVPIHEFMLETITLKNHTFRLLKIVGLSHTNAKCLLPSFYNDLALPPPHLRLRWLHSLFLFVKIFWGAYNSEHLWTMVHNMYVRYRACVTVYQNLGNLFLTIGDWFPLPVIFIWFALSQYFSFLFQNRLDLDIFFLFISFLPLLFYSVCKCIRIYTLTYSSWTNSFLYSLLSSRCIGTLLKTFILFFTFSASAPTFSLRLTLKILTSSIPPDSECCSEIRIGNKTRCVVGWDRCVYVKTESGLVVLIQISQPISLPVDP